MEPVKKPILAIATLIVLAAAGCSQKSKEGDVDQKSPQAVSPQASNDVNKVSGGVSASIDDTMITTKVKAAIVAEPALSAIDIKVNTNDGVVTLSGTIDAPDKADRAIQLAHTVDGVKAINNELVVKSQS